MSQHSFSAASAIWCHDPSFHAAKASLFRLYCNIVLYYLHFFHDPKQSFFVATIFFVHSSNSYVATSIINLQHIFSAASTSWCCDLSFHVATASLFKLCCNTVLYYLHFYRDPESLSRQRIIAIELVFLLKLCSNIATWLLGVVNICCRDPVFMPQQDSSVFSLIVMSQPSLLCHDFFALC